jgi:aspartate aminotransferase-like enzyme
MSIHLHIPGPVHVSEKTLHAMGQPMIGHRSQDFVALYQGIQPALASLFGTKDPVYLSTSSAWGVMEGSIRNVVGRRVLTCMNGAFSDKWFDVAQRCGKEATPLRFEWGQPVDPAAVRAQLATGAFDAITIIHNETSTGTQSPLAEIMAVVREFPEVISIVDTVSSFSALPIAKDELGIDIMLTGSQKALALPPGLSIFAVSERAHEVHSSSPRNRHPSASRPIWRAPSGKFPKKGEFYENDEYVISSAVGHLVELRDAGGHRQEEIRLLAARDPPDHPGEVRAQADREIRRTASRS